MTLPHLLASEPQSNGFWLAWAILIGMAIALTYTGVVVWRGLQALPPQVTPSRLRFAIPLLAVIGLAIAGYLAYVETGAVKAVCGPIGDCNTVQNSPYAKLFGIPIGAIGLAGYAVIAAAWAWGQRRDLPLADHMPLIVFCAALFSVLFSIYLTYLEIFVIRAVCIWCLTSAIAVTLIMLLSIRPMLQAGVET
ncbi:MAG TPA: vitamin K epoxide reductase family protein [Anaerolineales bacterium]|nr:vitamin K epoxide reductase family protein [Anaerolineales bacterium]